MAAKLSGAGERCGKDDEGATGEAKHTANKAKWIPAGIRAFRSRQLARAYKTAVVATIALRVSRLAGVLIAVRVAAMFARMVL